MVGFFDVFFFHTIRYQKYTCIHCWLDLFVCKPAWGRFVEGSWVIAQLWNLNHVAYILHSDRTWNLLRKNIFHLIFTFYLNRYTLVIEFSRRILEKKTTKNDSASPWDPCWPIYLQTKPSLKLLDCGRKNQIYIHIDTYFVNQNSDHDDKSTL